MDTKPGSVFGDINDPAVLRAQFDVRFHHFHDVNGKLVATIATMPLDEQTVDVSAAILFSGKDPIAPVLRELEAAIRAGDSGVAYALLGIALDAAQERPAVPPDAPSRALGRKIALGRLEMGECDTLSIDDLKEEITNRTLLRRFPGGKNLKLRGPKPFVAVADAE